MNESEYEEYLRLRCGCTEDEIKLILGNVFKDKKPKKEIDKIIEGE